MMYILLKSVSRGRLCLVIFLMLLSACTTTATGPVSIRDVRPAITPEVKHDDVVKPPSVQPVAPTKAVISSPLKQKLIKQSQQQLSNQNFSSAIALAERGLRVDRKEPRFYLVLSSAYYRSGNKSQSAYFAQQGLRYARKDSATYNALKQRLK